jgi:hypothetical protein
MMIGQLLIKKKLISQDQLERVLEEQRATREFTGEILIRKGLVSEFLFYRTLAEQFGIPFVDLSRTRIMPEAVACVPAEFARRHAVMAISFWNGVLTLGLANPLQPLPFNELSLDAVRDFKKVLCMPRHIQDSLARQYAEGSKV